MISLGSIEDAKTGPIIRRVRDRPDSVGLSAGTGRKANRNLGTVLMAGRQAPMAGLRLGPVADC